MKDSSKLYYAGLFSVAIATIFGYLLIIYHYHPKLFDKGNEYFPLFIYLFGGLSLIFYASSLYHFYYKEGGKKK